MVKEVYQMSNVCMRSYVLRIAYNAADKSRGNPRIISTTSYQVQFIMRKSILSSDSTTS